MTGEVSSAEDSVPEARSVDIEDQPAELSIEAEAGPPEPLEPVTQECAAAIVSLGDEIGRLREEVARDHARAQARERTIDHLHAEVERLRAGETRLLLRPVITDLRRLRDDLLLQARSLAETDSPLRADGIPSTKVAALLESFADSVELALERCGVSVARPVAGAPCDPAAHQVAGFAPTDDASLDGRIMTIVSDGYLDLASMRPVTPARVIVYRASAPAGDRVPGKGSR